MLKVAAGKFKAQCLALINHVAQSHETIIITKHGKPMVKVVPLDQKKDMKQKDLKNVATYIGDLVSPIDEAWEAER